MPNWTKEQQLAIDTEGSNIIVSAGAGSGKTAVLTQRVIRKLLSGVHINELLILTFTNAAAAEMRERIRKAIKKNDSLKEEENLLDSAYITTFDAFSLAIVKKYHTKLNITNNIKITDEVLVDIIKHNILDQIFDEFYEVGNDKFLRLIKDFCLKKDDELKNDILNIYKKIELKYDKEDYLNNYFSREFNSVSIDKYVNKYLDLIKSKINSIRDELSLMEEYFDGDYLEKCYTVLNPLLNSNSFEDICNNIDISLPPVPRGSDEAGKIAKANVSLIIKELKELLIYESVDEIKDELLSTKDNVEVIVDIIKLLDSRLSTYKLDNDIYNFTDISSMAIKIVSENEDIRNELKYGFNEILVDEYQDTSDTQEKFISLISNNNVYMVGDIKQSIYRFRNANPYIFKQKYDTYRDTDLGIKIDLNKNFRSRREVLENINLLFNLFMDDEIGGADYKTSHQMVFGNNSYVEEGMTEQNYNLDVFTYENDSKNISDIEKEIFIIGNDIVDKVNGHYQIFDKDLKVLRDVNYSDFVILLDKSKNFDLFKKIFEFLHIPLTILKDEALRKDDDILVLKSLLKMLVCIKNNNYDIEFKYSFISVARSFLYKVSDAEIYELFVDNKFMEHDLYKICADLVKNIDIMAPDQYLYYILEKLDYDLKLISVGNVKEFLIRNEYFYNLIRDFKASGNTIYDFIDYLDTIFKNNYDLRFSVNTSSSNSCKIMTIHKSKGLEFPICYFAGLSSSFNVSELRERILFDNNYGIIIPKVDGYYKDTILKTLMKVDTKREEVSEKIRLFYVALTRAKEKMIFVMKKQDEEVECLGFVSNMLRYKYSSFASILKSIYSVLLPYIVEKDIASTKDYLKSSNSVLNIEKTNVHLNVESLNISNSVIEETHYSKEIMNVISEDEKKTMQFGTKVHEILEYIDFDKSFVDDTLDNFLVSKINAFLDSDIISKYRNCKMYKEYEFIYNDSSGVNHGIIDLLIEDDDKYIIIDYKLKNIDDINYDKQLSGYRSFIKNKTGKNAECYLYSIFDSRFRQVK